MPRDVKENWSEKVKKLHADWWAARILIDPLSRSRRAGGRQAPDNSGTEARPGADAARLASHEAFDFAAMILENLRNRAATRPGARGSRGG